MRSNHTTSNNAIARAVWGCLTAVSLLTGCSVTPNVYVEDGPSVTMSRNSPSAEAIYDQYQSASVRARGWEAMQVSAASTAVPHAPLYFEDPFEDKGAQAINSPDGPDNVDFGNPQKLDWEDWFAVAYNYPRFTMNWLMLPVSAVVTHPWTDMESDGRLSRQALGYDHDAARVGE